MAVSDSNIYALSKTGKKIRLSDERWSHITESHDYMAGNKDMVFETLEEPDAIVNGDDGALIAVKHYLKTSIGEKNMVVVYKDIKDNGFVITAFMTSKLDRIMRKGIIWKKQQI